MPLYEFTTFIDIESEDYESAISWFECKTEGLDTYVMEIREK
jgi:hypothetical protein